MYHWWLRRTFLPGWSPDGRHFSDKLLLVWSQSTHRAVRPGWLTHGKRKHVFKENWLWINIMWRPVQLWWGSIRLLALSRHFSIFSCNIEIHIATSNWKNNTVTDIADIIYKATYNQGCVNKYNVDLERYLVTSIYTHAVSNYIMSSAFFLSLGNILNFCLM